MADGRVVVLVQARTGSKRMRGKSLRALCGQPMILHVLQRAAASGHHVVMATSVNENDDLLVEYALRAGYAVHRGSEWDVLTRMSEAAMVAGADTVVRVTGDCPLWAPDVGLEVLELYDSLGRRVMASNDTNVSGWADGLDTEVFPAEMLHHACAVATERSDREHVTPWIRRHASHHVLRGRSDWRSVKLSVDSPADFEVVSGVMEHLEPGSLDWPATELAYRRWLNCRSRWPADRRGRL